MDIELDYLMGRSPSEPIKSYRDQDAIVQRIMEWLDTAEGTVADMPAWGHPMMRFKHEPDSPSLRVLAEAILARKIRRDIEGIDLRRVRVSFPEIDHMSIAIDCGETSLSRDMSL